MHDYEASWLKRIIYALASLSGGVAIIWMALNFGEFWSMAMWTKFVYLITAIASLNWFPQIFTGDRRKDLLAYIGFK